MKSPQDVSRILAIQHLVARMFGMQREDLLLSVSGPGVMPRQMAMYISRQETNASLSEIGSLFGGKHHTTVIYSVEKIAALRQTDAATKLAIDIIRMNLR